MSAVSGLRRASGALGALVVLVAVEAGVPLLLAAVGGWPSHVPAGAQVLHQLTERDDGRLLGVVLAAGAWVCWALFTVSVAVELLGVLRRRPAVHLPGLGLLQRPAAALVAALVSGLLLSAASSAMGSSAGPASGLPAARVGGAATVAAAMTRPALALAPAPVTAERDGGPLLGQSPPLAAARVDAASRSESTPYLPRYVVLRRDTLWGIAQRHLGDPLRYREIVALNPAVVGSDNEIRAGAVLVLPADAAGVPVAGPAAVRGSAVRVTVAAGDTLWDLEQRVTGSGGNWPAGWQANAGRAEPGGQSYEDPDLIRPGWTLDVPTASATPAASPRTPDRSADASHGEALARGVPAPTPAASAPVPQPADPAAEERSRPQAAPTPPGAGVADDGESAPPLRRVAPAAPRPVPLAVAAPVKVPEPSAAAGEAAAPPPPRTGEHAGTSQARATEAEDSRGAGDSGVPALAGGGGVLLAGAALWALVRARRRQFRLRRPGRTVTATAPELVRMEQALLAEGPAGFLDVRWLDEALRGLARLLAEDWLAPLPDVVAARVSPQVLELLLAVPVATAPDPWTVVGEGERWVLRRDAELAVNPGLRGSVLAPFPTLASVGYTTDGDQWLLDLERLGAVSITGDPARCVDLLRFLAAELAHNPWSDVLTLTVAGFGEELAPLAEGRLCCQPDVAAAATGTAAQLRGASRAMTEIGTDVLTGRVRDLSGDAWAPSVLLVVPPGADGHPEAGESDPLGVDAVAGLLAAMGAQQTRAAVAVVTVGASPPQGTGWELAVDAQGRLRVPDLGIELVAQQLSAPEGRLLAELLGRAAAEEDAEAPAGRGDEPWDAYTDACGALRVSASSAAPAAGSARAHAGEPGVVATALPAQADEEGGGAPAAAETPGEASPALAQEGGPTGRGQERAPVAAAAALRLARRPDLAVPVGSVLPLAPAEYVRRASTTVEDLHTLAPLVPAEVRRRVEDADRGLDADLHDWHDRDCRRPKVTLLGPVEVRAAGPVPNRRPFHSEVVAFLVSHSRGVSTEQYGEAIWPGERDLAGKSKVRNSVSTVREWLGRDGEGRDYLPRLDGTGTGLYRVRGALIDAELFRRLRVRGVSRGGDGVEDLQAALDLVGGPPLSGLRPGGYGWLVQDPLDHDYAAMVVDLAHLLAVRYSGDDRAELAERAALVAVAADTGSDVPLLDLVAACDALGKTAEGDTYVQRVLRNHDAEMEEDLPIRTAEILMRRQRWGHAS